MVRSYLYTRPWAPILILVVLGFLWGGATNVARFVALSGVPPIAYAFWTVVIGATILTAINLVRRKFIPCSFRHLRYYFFAGLLSSALPTANLFLCLNYISVGAMSLVLITIPLITYSLSLGIGIERLNAGRAVGILLGFFGVLIVILPGNGLSPDDSVGWFLMAFLTPVGYAAGQVFTARYHPDDVDSLIGANALMLVATTLLLIVTIFSNQWYSLWQDPGLVDFLITLHGLVAALAYACFFLLVGIAGPVYFSQSSYLITLFGLLIGHKWFGEEYSPLLLAAVALTAIGVWLVNRGQQHNASQV